jgi:hypothetical protein
MGPTDSAKMIVYVTKAIGPVSREQWTFDRAKATPCPNDHAVDGHKSG